MHQSLLDIPVNEVPGFEDTAMTIEDDEDDVHFLEEGRRLLALSRFHVLRDNRGGSVESVDALFAHVWSELAELARADTPHTGSIILLPDYELDSLRRFTDMSVQQPLRWLGLMGGSGSSAASSTTAARFEVVSLQRDSPAIRVLYKLEEMRSSAGYTEEEGFAAEADGRSSSAVEGRKSEQRRIALLGGCLCGSSCMRSKSESKC